MRFTLKNNKAELLTAANDLYEAEGLSIVMEAMGDNYPACLFVENDYDLVGYKNAMVWCAIECFAYNELIEESI